MRIEGTIKRDGRKWVARISLLDIEVTASSRTKSLEAVQGALGEIIGKAAGCSVDDDGDKFWVVSTDVRTMLALCLKRQRAASGLTFSEVGIRLGKNSKNYWATYEWGNRTPSVEQFDKMLRVLGMELCLDGLEKGERNDPDKN